MIAYIGLALIVVFVVVMLVKARYAKNTPRLPAELEELPAPMKVPTHPTLTKWLASLTVFTVTVVLVSVVPSFYQIYAEAYLHWRSLGRPPVLVDRIVSASLTDVSVQLANGEVHTFTHSSLLQNLPLTPCHLNTEDVGSPPGKIVYTTRVPLCSKIQFGKGTVEIDVDVRYVVLQDSSVWRYESTDATLANLISIFLLVIVAPLMGIFCTFLMWRHLSQKWRSKDASQPSAIADLVVNPALTHQEHQGPTQ